jgi:hypothetical protein
MGEWRYSSAHSSSSALDEGELSVSRPGRFNHKERASAIQSRSGRSGEEKNSQLPPAIEPYP